MCNITFMFFPGKEALLVFMDELINRTMSNSLRKRLDQMENGFLLTVRERSYTVTQMTQMLA